MCRVREQFPGVFGYNSWESLNVSFATYTVTCGVNFQLHIKHIETIAIRILIELEIVE